MIRILTLSQAYCWKATIKSVKYILNYTWQYDREEANFKSDIHSGVGLLKMTLELKLRISKRTSFCLLRIVIPSKANNL